MALTQKQENFCLAYIETGNASEAYRRAYDSDASATTVNRSAKEVLDNPKIAARVDELRAPVREKALITLESHLARLEELSIKAEQSNQFSAAIKAEENRGKAAGLYVEKVDLRTPEGIQVSVSQVSDEELVEKLKELGLGREAGQLATKIAD